MTGVTLSSPMIATGPRFRPAFLRAPAALSLALLLPLEPAVAAMRSVPPATTVSSVALPETEQALTITILEGEGALNNIRQRTAREPIVQVEDKNHKPVAGALILFAVREGSGGAGGTFNGAPALRVTTDAEGKAVAHGWTPNSATGNYVIAVTATIAVVTLTAYIHQQNVDPLAPGSNSTLQPPPPLTGLHGFVNRPIVRGMIVGLIEIGFGVLIAVLASRGPGAARITVGAGGVTAP